MERTPALTAFLVWVDLDGMVRAENGPEMPVLDVRRTASLEDIATYSESLGASARMEMLRRSLTPPENDTATIISKALKKRRG